MEQDRREYELTKHISLAQLDPVALLKLRQHGECVVDIPEVAFDMDGPGHYFRRIKAVSLSIPCTGGPYATLACMLTLTSSHLRNDSTLLVATSSAQNDDGMFKLSFSEERYLPFEGADAISTWHLKLSKGVPQIDFANIVDVVFHLYYTARQG